MILSIVLLLVVFVAGVFVGLALSWVFLIVKVRQLGVELDGLKVVLDKFNGVNRE